jgi:pyridoxamine 5'-phosphate oxidase
MHDAPSAATIPHFPQRGSVREGKFTLTIEVLQRRERRLAGRDSRAASFANPVPRGVKCAVISPMPAPPIDLAQLRVDYKRAALSERDAAPDPFDQFARWLGEAEAAAVPEANAMTLATVDASGRPGARVVLLKSVDARGLVFHTNYDSRKGLDLAANPRAALLFFWAELERQVRIEGIATRVRADESDAYFAQRPHGSQLAAWASPQSSPIADRGWLEDQFAATEARFATPVPRPPNWGGVRVAPDRFEFWQGRASRLHDRLVWTRAGAGWTIARLAP